MISAMRHVAPQVIGSTNSAASSGHRSSGSPDEQRFELVHLTFAGSSFSPASSSCGSAARGVSGVEPAFREAAPLRSDPHQPPASESPRHHRSTPTASAGRELRAAAAETTPVVRKESDHRSTRRSDRVPLLEHASPEPPPQRLKYSSHASVSPSRFAVTILSILRNSKLLKPELPARATGFNQNFAFFLSRWTCMWGGSSPSLL